MCSALEQPESSSIAPQGPTILGGISFQGSMLLREGALTLKSLSPKKSCWRLYTFLSKFWGQSGDKLY